MKRVRLLARKRLDKYFVDYLETEVILDLGIGHRYSRQNLVDLGCGNLTAARRLDNTLGKHGVMTVRQLFDFDPFELMRIVGFGNAQMWVAMVVLDASGYNVSQWWNWNRKFSSAKVQARKMRRKR